MSAERAEVVGRKLGAFAILESADLAAPADNLLSCIGGSSRSGFDLGLVVVVCQRALVAGSHGVIDLCDEKGVAAQILLADYVAAENGAGLEIQVGQAVGVDGALEVREFVDIAAALHSEALDGVELAALVQDTQTEDSAFLDHVAGEVSVDACDCNPGGVRCHLDAGVGDASVDLSVLAP